MIDGGKPMVVLLDIDRTEPYLAKLRENMEKARCRKSSAKRVDPS